MPEPVLLLADPLPVAKLVGRHPAGHRNVLPRGPQILPQRQDVHRGLAQVGHRLADLARPLPHPQDDARLGQHRGVDTLGAPEVRDRAPVAATGPHVGVEPLDRLEVVAQDGGPRLHHRAERVLVALEVGNQHLDGTVRQPVAHLADRRRVDARAAVGEFVPVHRGDDDMVEIHGLDRLGDAAGLVQVEFGGHPVRDRAVLAGAGADVAQDHEGGGAVLPALADVGTAGLLADRVQRLAAHHALQPQVVRPPGGPHLEPRRLARGDGDGVDTAMGRDPGRALRLDRAGVLARGRVAACLRGSAPSICVCRNHFR